MTKRSILSNHDKKLELHARKREKLTGCNPAVTLAESDARRSLALALAAKDHLVAVLRGTSGVSPDGSATAPCRAR